nr:MAG TPA: TonB dependent receptor [Caudoviricetes sp.]
MESINMTHTAHSECVNGVEIVAEETTPRHLSGGDGANIKKHDSSYQLWKFTLQQRFLDAVNLNFTVDNLFDYTPEKYYWSSAMTTGRTFSVGLSVDIDRIVNLF